MWLEIEPLFDTERYRETSYQIQDISLDSIEIYFQTKLLNRSSELELNPRYYDRYKQWTQFISSSLLYPIIVNILDKTFEFSDFQFTNVNVDTVTVKFGPTFFSFTWEKTRFSTNISNKVAKKTLSCFRLITCTYIMFRVVYYISGVRVWTPIPFLKIWPEKIFEWKSCNLSGWHFQDQWLAILGINLDYNFPLPNVLLKRDLWGQFSA